MSADIRKRIADVLRRHPGKEVMWQCGGCHWEGDLRRYDEDQWADHVADLIGAELAAADADMLAVLEALEALAALGHLATPNRFVLVDETGRQFGADGVAGGAVFGAEAGPEAVVAPTLAELTATARHELDTNPTITAYLMVDGREVPYMHALDVIQTAINNALRTVCDIIGLGSDFVDNMAEILTLEALP